MKGGKWRALSQDVLWDHQELQHLVSTPRRERHQIRDISHAFLTSIYLFFWHDARSSSGWRQTSRTRHLQPKEAAAQVILNASGLNAGPSAAQHACKKAYDGCIAIQRHLDRAGEPKLLRDHLEKNHLFMAGLTELVQQDPILLQLLRQNEQLDLQLNFIAELRAVNLNLEVQCTQLDSQMETAAEANDDLKLALHTARDAVEGANYALVQVDLDKALLSDGATLLARLGKAERELRQIKKYGKASGTRLLSKRVIEVERLLSNTRESYGEAERGRIRVEEEMAEMKAQISQLEDRINHCHIDPTTSANSPDCATS